MNGVLKVKESGLVSTWGKRFCILVGSKLFIFPSIQPKRKPNLTVILYGSSIEVYKTKKHGFGIRITQPHKSKVVSLGFSTISERTRWTKGLQKVSLSPLIYHAVCDRICCVHNERLRLYSSMLLPYNFSIKSGLYICPSLYILLMKTPWSKRLELPNSCFVCSSNKTPIISFHSPTISALQSCGIKYHSYGFCLVYQLNCMHNVV